MRFDPTKALEAFRELSDPRFAGPDGESQVADFVADRFATMGLTVDRRQVVGSAFPQRIAPWVGWLGYGLLVTAAYGLFRMESVGAAALAFVIGFLVGPLVYYTLRGGVRLGRRRPPLENVPLVVASMPVSPPPPVRVVFQAVIGGLRPDPFMPSSATVSMTSTGSPCFPRSADSSTSSPGSGCGSGRNERTTATSTISWSLISLR